MSEDKTAGAGASQILTDLGPALLFMVTYNLANRFGDPADAIYWATGVFIPATLAAIAYAWFKQKRLPPMLIVTAVIVIVFGGLTLYLRDPIFVKIKPTIINLLWAAVIFGGLLVRVNVWKLLFQSAFPALPDKTWTVFAIRWGLFFIFLAALNEYIWRSYSEVFWANFKVFGMIPITLAFMALNLPLLMKHMPQDKKDQPAPPL